MRNLRVSKTAMIKKQTHNIKLRAVVLSKLTFICSVFNCNANFNSS